MNSRYLTVVLALLVCLGLAYAAQSLLTPEQAAEHILYGLQTSDGLTEQMVAGDVNGDGRDDAITGAMWDNPAIGGAPLDFAKGSFNCTDLHWPVIRMALGPDTSAVCSFVDKAGRDQIAYWQSLGYAIVDTIDALECADCVYYELQTEDYGAIHVYYANSLDSQPKDVDPTLYPPDLIVYGKLPGDKLIYVATGNVNKKAENVSGDPKHYSDLILGAIQYAHRGNPPYTAFRDSIGEVYVILGSSTLPATIDLANPTDEANYVEYYFSGRDISDQFGYSLASGDLDGDGNDDIVIAAPEGDGPNNSTPGAGEIFVFYSTVNLPKFPQKIELSALSDSAIAGYATVIYGPHAGAHIGVTRMGEIDPNGSPAQSWGYSPPGLAIGDWNNDGTNDIVIGAGNADNSTGAVYWVPGGPKLTPGNIVDLSAAPNFTSAGAPGAKIQGASAFDAFGSGVWLYDVDGNGTDDLVIGASLVDSVGAAINDNRGAAYILFDSQVSTFSGNTTTITPSVTGVTIIGENPGDHFGTYIAGNGNFDGDKFGSIEVHDLIIGGRYAFPAGEPRDPNLDGNEDEWGEAVVFFGRSQTEWLTTPTIDLSVWRQTYPNGRMIKLTGVAGAESNTVLFAKMHNDPKWDIVFGGYDAPDFVGNDIEINNGQMYIIKGQDTWKSGTLTTSTTWTGNVFVNGDITVASGATLTLAAGTHVWIWPNDPGKSGGDTTQVEFYVDGTLLAQGTASSPVEFALWEADSLVTRAPGRWFGIFVGLNSSAASATLDHCLIRNAYRALQARVPVTVRNTTIRDCQYIGISLASPTAAATVDSVTITGTQYGFNILDAASAAISNTTVTGASTYGARVYSAASATFTDCTFDSADYGILVTPQDSATASAVISGCSFSGHDYGVNEGSGASLSISGSTIQNSTVENIHVDGLGTTTIDGNTITGSPVGIWVDNGNHATIQNNTIDGNSQGVRTDNFSAPLIRTNSIKNSSIGVGALNNADPDLGYGCGMSCTGCTTGGGNSFKANSSQHVVNLTYSITIQAECNYWKKMKGKFSGAVDHTPSLGSDPLPVTGRPNMRKRLPAVFDVSQNYPNPFNPTTTIRYQVPAPGSHVSIRIYDVSGHLVRTLVSRQSPPGFYRAVWDGTNAYGVHVSSGVYFLQMRASHFVKNRKIVALK